MNYIAPKYTVGPGWLSELGNFSCIWYLHLAIARASSNYFNFLKRHLYLRNRILDQGYYKIRLIRSRKMSIFRYQDLVEKYSISALTIINDGCSHKVNMKMYKDKDYVIAV